MSKTKICTYCRAEIPVLATKCQSCGSRNEIPKDRDGRGLIPEITPTSSAESKKTPLVSASASQTLTVEYKKTPPMSASASQAVTVDLGSAHHSAEGEDDSNASSLPRPSMAVPIPAKKRSRHKTLLSHGSSPSLFGYSAGAVSRVSGANSRPAPPPFSSQSDDASEKSPDTPMASAQMMEEVIADASVLELVLEGVDDDSWLVLEDDESVSKGAATPSDRGKAPTMPRAALATKSFFQRIVSFGQSKPRDGQNPRPALIPGALPTRKRQSFRQKSLGIGVGLAAGLAAIGGYVALFGGAESTVTMSDEVAVQQLVEDIAVHPEPADPIAASLPSGPEKQNAANMASQGQGTANPLEECLFIGDLPEFPWRSFLERGLAHLKKNGICHFFGLDPARISSALIGIPSFGPTGYDLLPSAQVMEFYPSGKISRFAPTLVFVFVGNVAVEIRLNYGSRVAKGLQNDVFAETFGDAVQKGKDGNGRQFVRYYDGDMVAEQFFRKDDYGRVFKEIRFTSKQALSHLKTAYERMRRAEAAFTAGMLAYNEHKLAEALSGFKKAQQLVPGYGAAYIWEGRLHVGEERFEQAVDVARLAMERSGDQRVLAEAWGLQGVSALYEGNQELALQHFRTANEVDPARSEFKNSVDELESGEYRPDRVAKTAARMSCSYDKKRRTGGLPDHAKSWTVKGLLARGNFPDSDTYNRALKKSKRSRVFKREYKRWVTWECR